MFYGQTLINILGKRTQLDNCDRFAIFFADKVDRIRMDLDSVLVIQNPSVQGSLSSHFMGGLLSDFTQGHG